MKNKRQIITLVAIFMSMGLMYYLASVQVPKILVSSTKANVAGKLSVKDSYVLGEKLLAKADGEDKCIVNVFLLDSDGKGISGKAVELTGMKNIRAKSTVTDKDGKITFEMTSTTEGQFKVVSPLLNKEVTVTFRN